MTSGEICLGVSAVRKSCGREFVIVCSGELTGRNSCDCEVTGSYKCNLSGYFFRYNFKFMVCELTEGKGCDVTEGIAMGKS